MSQRSISRALFTSFGITAIVWGCNSTSGTPIQPIVAPLTPSQAPSSSTPSVAGAATSAATAAAAASGSVDGFRDDFDGSSVSSTRWDLFTQSGLDIVQNGYLDLLNSAGQKNFPYMVTHNNIVPTTGPFFVEYSYEYISYSGGSISFCLDYLPAEEPGDVPVTTPFMSTVGFYNNLSMSFTTEAGNKTFLGLKGVVPSAFHRVRIENDGQTTYRVIFDQTELGTFTSKRRPMKFWIGQNPPKDLSQGTSWPRIRFDYVAAGTLTTPDPALPAAVASASPTP